MLSPGFANFNVSKGHASTHNPHLIQVAKKSSSFRAPGGRNINELAFTSSTNALHVKPPRTAKPAALAIVRKNFLLSFVVWFPDVLIFFSFLS